MVLLSNEAREICQEIIRCGIERVNVALDCFDASINHLSARVTGFRNLQKSLLLALLQPNEELKAMQNVDN